jgi:iron complex outermembrane receptor protein
MLSTLKKTSPIAAAVAAAIFGASSARAADAAGAADAADSASDSSVLSSESEVIVTGTRQKGIVAAESAAPIQIISGDALRNTGKTNMIDALAQLVPSFQAQAFGADMANQTLQARLRGLSPNHVLVLVDGKRRHTTASLAIDGGSAYSGGAGVDLNFIPMAMVDHIEVLTDGAAAQYGSDAIAGVINFILKKNSSGGSVNATYGGFFDGGGSTTEVDANAGFAPVENSFFNITAQVSNHGHTDRGNPDPRTDPAYYTGSYPNSNIPLAPGYPDINHIQGDAETHFKLVGFNAGVDLPGNVQLYSNGTYGTKDAKSYENYRVPNKVVYDPATAAASAAADGLTPPAAGTTITTYPFPLGFNPLEESKENDFQLVAGLKGSIVDWTWDLAQAYGEDHMDIYTIDSANASLYADTGSTPTNFYDGKFISTQSTTTLDIARDFDLGLAGPLTVAFGGEHRRETWVLGPGELNSYLGGGAQSFPGYAATLATNASRHSDAGYIDLAATPITGLKLDVAGRYEDYSDFGSATVGKFTARYDFDPKFALRGTISSGFRAPTLVEEHYTNVNVGPKTAYVQLAPDGPGTGLLGLGGGLKPERSTNLSFGLVFRPLDTLTATLDVYQILVTNRIVASGNINGQTGDGVHPATPIPGAENVTAAIIASGLSIDPGVLADGSTGINLFANGVDTRTRGVDFTLSSPMDLPLGHVDWTVGGSYNYTVATRVLGGTPEMGGQPLFDAQSISALTTQAPRITINLGGHYTVSSYYVDLHEIIYGKSSSCDNPDSDPSPTPLQGPTCAAYAGGLYYYENRIGTVAITNLELGMSLKDTVTVAIGANNIFNRYPNTVDKNYTAVEASGFDNAAVQKYSAFSPFGIDGGFYYARLSYKF